MRTDRTIVEAIADALRRHGIDFILGQSVPSAFVLACEDRGIRQITYRQENMGGVIADGYARVSGRIPVIACQNGPAAALLVAPLAEAKTVGIPIVAIVQEVDRAHIGRNAFQEYDHQALFAPVCKFYRRVESVEDIEDHVDAAFAAAGSGRPGPAVLMLPVDLQRQAAGRSARRMQRLDHWPLDRPVADPVKVAEAAKLIAEARMPVLLAGGGVHASGANDALAELQDLAHIPVFTTNMGKGAVAETHALSAGPLGSLVGPGSLGRHTRTLMNEADLVVLVGTRTNEDGTDKWRAIPRDARIIHIDIDPQEVGRNYEALRLVGDARSTLAALVKALVKLDLEQRKAARPEIVRRLSAAWSAFEQDRRPFIQRSGTPLRPEQVMAVIQPHLDPRTIVVADASYSSNWIVGQLRVSDPATRIVTPRGLAGLGWGLPLALGAKLGRSDARVIAVVGDGGFAHAWAELETAIRSDIPVSVVVLNNGVLGYQKDAEHVKFGRYTSSGHLGHVDHAAIARACGAGGETAETINDLEATFANALQSPRLALIDVLTDPGAHPPIALYDGSLDTMRDGVVEQRVVD
jgi:acetolactate synthase-1/2/3 large subunit